MVPAIIRLWRGMHLGVPIFKKVYPGELPRNGVIESGWKSRGYFGWKEKEKHGVWLRTVVKLSENILLYAAPLGRTRTGGWKLALTGTQNWRGKGMLGALSNCLTEESERWGDWPWITQLVSAVGFARRSPTSEIRVLSQQHADSHSPFQTTSTLDDVGPFPSQT